MQRLWYEIPKVTFNQFFSDELKNILANNIIKLSKMLAGRNWIGKSQN